MIFYENTDDKLMFIAQLKNKKKTENDAECCTNYVAVQSPDGTIRFILIYILLEFMFN